MSETKNLIYIIILAAFVSACTEKIDIPLRDAKPVLMIEGNISDTFDLPIPFTLGNSTRSLVLISTTTSYTDTNFFHGISGAVVTINDGIQTDTLMEVPMFAGAYINTSLATQAGKTYTLTVNLNDTIYQATSSTTFAVPIDSLTLSASAFGGDPRLYCFFKDLAGETNYYKADLWINGEFQSRVRVSDDNITNGTIKRISLNISDCEPGDTIDVFLKSIDKGAYTYFFTLSNASASSAAPANPTGNIEGGSMGYFNAYTSSHQRMIYQPD